MIPFLHGALGVAGYASDFELIDTQTVGAGGAASITFSSIPGTYKHLQIRGIARSTGSGTALDDIFFRANSDTGTNYARHTLYGDGATAASTGNASATYAVVGTGPRAGLAANIFGAFVLDLLDYTSTTKNKTVKSLWGCDLNGSGQIRLGSGVWLNTTAVTSISLVAETTGFAQYSTFSLYGVK